MMMLQKLNSVVFALLFVASSASLVYWMHMRVESLGTELLDHKQTIANEEVFEQQYGELQAMVVETEVEREYLKQFVLQDDKDAIALLSKIDEIALNHGVELITEKLVDVPGTEHFDNLSVSFTIIGSEISVTKIIKMFETMPYHGHVTSLSIRRTENDATGNLDVSATISLLISIKKHD